MTDRKVIVMAAKNPFLPDATTKQEYQAIFIPSSREMFSLSGPPFEQLGSNCKYISIKKYFDLVISGDLDQVEFLFSSPGMIRSSSSEWELIRSNARYFLHDKAIQKYLKTVVDQINLIKPRQPQVNIIRDIIHKINNMSPEQQKANFCDHCTISDSAVIFGTIKIEHYINEIHELMISFGERTFKADIQTKVLRDKLRSLEARLGSRPAEDPKYDFDYRSLATCLKLLDYVESLVTDEKIELPYPKNDFLKSIINGSATVSDLDLYNSLKQRVADISELARKNSKFLNEKVINDIYFKILNDHYRS